MIKTAVYTPAEYCMSEKAIEIREKRYEQICHATEIKLGEYCELYYTFDGLSNSNKEHGKKEYMNDCVIDMVHSDCAVFADNWESSDECVRLHKIAEALDKIIVEWP